MLLVDGIGLLSSFSCRRIMIPPFRCGQLAVFWENLFLNIKKIKKFWLKKREEHSLKVKHAFLCLHLKGNMLTCTKSKMDSLIAKMTKCKSSIDYRSKILQVIGSPTE
eukprot:GHVR01139271.1.p1 GENE.GHVR01139271.1~~GHVR01139271.1.p1  ORF type:complete len:108 (+),score=0.25 GHVR01139271.1:2072-2395(+)